MVLGVRVARGQDWTWDNQVRIQGLTGADFIPYLAVGVRWLEDRTGHVVIG